VDHARWTVDGGIPLEIMIDLCNRQQVEPWFCMPHLADDDYIRNFATMVKKVLDPSLTVHIEYSNEIWNSIFEQHKWAGEKGMEAGLAERPWEAAWRYYAVRSLRVFAIWEEVFGEESERRLSRVLATQAANPHIAGVILSTEDAGRKVDALSIAPYITFNVLPADRAGNDPSAEDVAQWPVEDVLNHVKTRALPKAIEWMHAHKVLADNYDLTLTCYEAGQHLSGFMGAENNPQLIEVFFAANRHPIMGEIYREYYDAWKEMGGDLLAVFSSIGAWSKWGTWGLMQYMTDDPREQPKMKATLDWMEQNQPARLSAER
jgi:hypothetical protein